MKVTDSLKRMESKGVEIMVFRCPTCGRFIKTELREGDSHLGTCKNCDINYIARYGREMQDTGEYESWISVWPALSNPDKGRHARYELNK